MLRGGSQPRSGQLQARGVVLPETRTWGKGRRPRGRRPQRPHLGGAAPPTPQQSPGQEASISGGLPSPTALNQSPPVRPRQGARCCPAQAPAAGLRCSAALAPGAPPGHVERPPVLGLSPGAGPPGLGCGSAAGISELHSWWEAVAKCNLRVDWCPQPRREACARRWGEGPRVAGTAPGTGGRQRGQCVLSPGPPLRRCGPLRRPLGLAFHAAWSPQRRSGPPQGAGCSRRSRHVPRGPRPRASPAPC